MIESDRIYFELGAECEVALGAELAVMPGLETLPGACVVHRVDPRSLGCGPREWVEQIVRRLNALGCTLARVYLDSAAPPLESALSAVGFRRRIEIAFATGGPLHLDAGSGLALVEIEGAEEWERKRRLHRGADVAADGHPSEPDAWVELERLKCTAGMKAFLVEMNGEAVGAISALEVAGLMRGKNLFVRPDRRREGIAGQAVAMLSRRATELGLAVTGMFGVDGNPGAAVYRSLGLDAVAQQIEWSLPLPAR